MKKKLLFTVFLGITFGLFATKNTASTSISILELLPPTITSQPEDVTIGVGDTAQLTVAADNLDTVQWEFSPNNGSSWFTANDGPSFSGSTTTTLSFTIDVVIPDGYLFRAVLTSPDGDSVTSNSARVIVIEYTQIPDPNFEAALSTYDDVPNDGRVPTDNINTVTRVDVRNDNISDLTGIEDFTALEELIMFNNNISSLDLSNNTALSSLSASNNNLSTIDVSTNTNLTLVALQDNNLTSFDTTGLTSLQFLILNNNPIISLDVSTNTALQALLATGCDLTSLNLQNGNNTNVTQVQITNNPLLFCVLVDDVAYSTANWTQIDAQTTFSDTVCATSYIAIPDSNFETALFNLGYDDITGDNQVPLNNIISVTNLDVSSKSISDLTGIEAFLSLTSLNVSRNSILTLDLTDNSNIQSINASQNELTSIDIAGLAQLTTVNLSDNDLTNIDLSAFPNLVEIYLDSNNLTDLNLQNGANATIINLDIQSNDDLICVLVDDENIVNTATVNADAQTRFSAVSCAYTTIPDVNFETALHAQGYDDILGDGQVPTSFINTLTLLDVSDSNIADLTGIADFTALERLNANTNNLTTLDVSNNTSLFFLEAAFNAITSINLGTNTNYEAIAFNNNNLTSFDVTGLTALQVLLLSNNALTTLDASTFSALQNLNVSDNTLSSLNITGLAQLTDLNASNNNLTSIDLSAFSNLEEIYLNDNNLTDLNLQNGANSTIVNLDIQNNSNLICVLADDENIVNTATVNADAQTRFSSVSCNYTAIPDANFEAALEVFGYDDISGDGQVPTSFINTVTNLDVSNTNISDLTGIEDFTALEELYITNNNLMSLDVSNNSALFNIAAAGNNIDTLNLGSNTNYTTLVFSSNNFTSFDATNLTVLQTLDLSNNDLITIDISGLTQLATLNLSNNNLTSLDFSNITGLVEIYLNNNDLVSVNLRNGNNGSITDISVEDNLGLNCVLVDDEEIVNTVNIDFDPQTRFSSTFCEYTAIPDANFEARLEVLGYDDISGDGQVPTELIEGVTSLDIDAQNIADLTGIEAFAALDELLADDNNITAVDFSSNTLLRRLFLRNNSITSLDLTANSRIQRLLVENNGMTDLNVTGLTNLDSFFAAGNNLTSLDLSSNIRMKILGLGSNNLSYLNMQNGNNENITIWQTTNNPNLTCIVVDDIAYADANFTNKDPQTSYTDTFCRYTQIPDTAFEAALDNLGYDDITGDGQVPTALIEGITTLDVSSEGIADMTGIEDFVALQLLDASANDIISLNLSTLTALAQVLVQNNELTTFNVKNGNNININTLNTTGNPNLSCILVDDVDFATINFTNIDAATTFSDTDYCRYTSIPDSNFEAALFALGYDDISGDNQAPTALIEQVVSLNLLGENISNFSGLEDFLALEDLSITFNTISSLDLSANTNLIKLELANNGLTSINLFGLTALEELDLSDNDLESLDLSDNVNLEKLYLGNNTNLLSLDLSANANLLELNVTDTSLLTSINFGSSSAINTLDAQNSGFTSLELSALSNLTDLNLSGSLLSDLDLSANSALEKLSIRNTPLESLNLQNGNNTAISVITLAGNSNLFCVLVDDATYSANNWILVDGQINFTDIFCLYTTIPDANFEARLEALGYDDISGDGQVPTALIETVTILDASNLNISDATGIEDFTALTDLNLSSNNLTTVDITNSINLKTVDLHDNTIATIDLSTLIALEDFRINNNPLTSLELASNIALQNFDASTTNLTTINVSGLSLLENVYLNNSDLTALDLSTNVNLKLLEVSNANLSLLNIQNGNNTSITNFNTTNNPNLMCLQVDDVAYSTTNWTNIDVQTNFSTNCSANFSLCLDAITADNEIESCQAEVTIPMPSIIDLNSGSVLNDNLEIYTDGPIYNQSDNWDTWTPNTAAESSNVSTEQARSGRKSLKVAGAPFGDPENTVFYLGDRASGAWEVKYYLYIPSGNTANVTLQKSQIAGTEYANEISFLSDGTGGCNINGSSTSFNYPQNEWFEVTYLVNIDDDYAEFFINGTAITSHPYSYTATDTNGVLTTLGAVNFYPNANASSLFYVDDLSLRTVAVNDYNLSADASDIYPVGATDVVWTYTDVQGNISTCTQVITVNDTEFPVVINCPEDVTVCNGTRVSYETPMFYENCEPIATPDPIDNYFYLGNFGNKAYYVSNELAVAGAAFSRAQSLGGHAATITSQEHNDWLRTKLNQRGVGAVTIGLTDRSTEGTFVWHSGEAVTYTNWNTGEPNNAFVGDGEDYVVLANSGFWNDVSNFRSRRFVIEISVFPMTQTAGLSSGSEFPIGTTTNVFEAVDAAGNVTTCSFDVIVEICPTDFSLALNVFLQGAALNPNTGEENLMRDDLREAGYLPTTSPYADGITCDPSVFNITGNDAIVDWIWVELRDPDDTTIVSYERSALLQRDGDVVDVDGISPLDYLTDEDSYYVAVHHRNHLGIMSADAIGFTEGETASVNLTDATTTLYGSNSQTDFGMPTDVNALWCGDVNQDAVVQYSGTSPDTPDILSEVLNDAGNFLNFPTYSLTGYNDNDTNMDGVIQYSGTNPDTPFILQNVLAHPENFLNFSTYQILEQLPENISSTNE
ncbi:MAG: lectin-like protein [Bacteroidota bacterium]